MCEKWPDFGEKHWLDVHREEWIDDLASLLKIPSLSQKCCPESSQPFGKECAEALDRALAIAQKYGLEVQCHQYYCGTAVFPGTQPLRSQPYQASLSSRTQPHITGKASLSGRSSSLPLPVPHPAARRPSRPGRSRSAPAGGRDVDTSLSENTPLPERHFCKGAPSPRW